MNSKSNYGHNTAATIGTLFFAVTATCIIGWMTYELTGQYLHNEQMKKKSVETKLEELEARLDSLKASRNTNVTIRTLTNAEKNKLWWRIAKVGTKTGGGNSGKPTKYSLSHAQASIVAEEYGLSVPNVFEFFRNNGGASWRTDKPPGEEKEEPIFK